MQLACTCSSLVRAAAALAAPRVRTQQRSLMRPAPGPQRPSRSPAAAVVTTAAVARPGASSDDVGRDFASSLALMVLGGEFVQGREAGSGSFPGMDAAPQGASGLPCQTARCALAPAPTQRASSPCPSLPRPAPQPLC